MRGKGVRTKVQYRILAHGLWAPRNRKAVVRKTWRGVARALGISNTLPASEDFPLFIGVVGGHITVEREVVS